MSYNCLTCPLAGCHGSLSVKWETLVYLTLDHAESDLAVESPDVATWEIVCAYGHVIFTPSDCEEFIDTTADVLPFSSAVFNKMLETRYNEN